MRRPYLCIYIYIYIYLYTYITLAFRAPLVQTLWFWTTSAGAPSVNSSSQTFVCLLYSHCYFFILLFFSYFLSCLFRFLFVSFSVYFLFFAFLKITTVLCTQTVFLNTFSVRRLFICVPHSDLLGKCFVVEGRYRFHENMLEFRCLKSM